MWCREDNVRSHSLILGLAIVAACSDVTDTPVAPYAAVARQGPILSVTISPDSATLRVGDSLALRATVVLRTGQVAQRDVEWRSTKPAVATVSARGMLRAVAPGTTLIIVREGGVDTARVTVDAAVVPPEADTAGAGGSDGAEGGSGGTGGTVQDTAGDGHPGSYMPPPPPPTSAGAELPRTYLDTRYVTPTGRTINVAAGGDLQAALHAAQPGDEVVLEAGATYSGNFILPRKSGTGWITVRSSALGGLPPEGSRITPRSQSLLPRLVAPNPMPVLQTAAGAHHYRLVGLEITMPATARLSYSLVNLGSAGRDQSTLASVPTDIVLDRVYVHGHPTLDFQRCIALNSARTAIIDSYISECHSRGHDSQAIGGWNGPGPYKIVNNYLEGAGENVMFGGATMHIPGMVPSDIEVRRNHFYKPLAWKGVWAVKNLFELKSGRRILVEGNIFDGSWRSGQIGEALVWKSGQSECWNEVGHVTFRYNIVRNAGAFLLTTTGTCNIPTHDLVLHDNVVSNINTGSYPGSGRLWVTTQQIGAVTFVHNTILSDAASHLALMNNRKEVARIEYRDNIMSLGGYGLFANGGADGARALDAGSRSWVFAGNVVLGVPWNLGIYPTGNAYVSGANAVGFAGFAAGNFRLAPSSPYKGKATDGRDPGADIDAVELMTRGVVVP